MNFNQIYQKIIVKNNLEDLHFFYSIYLWFVGLANIVCYHSNFKKVFHLLVKILGSPNMFSKINQKVFLLMLAVMMV